MALKLIGRNFEQKSLENRQAIQAEADKQNKRLDLMKQDSRKTGSCIYMPRVRCSGNYQCKILVEPNDCIHPGQGRTYHLSTSYCTNLAEKILGMKLR